MRGAAGRLTLLLLAAALVGGTGAQRGPPKAHPRHADIPFIQCQVRRSVLYFNSLERCRSSCMAPSHSWWRARRRAGLEFPEGLEFQLCCMPHIVQVCELLAKNAWKQVKEMTKTVSPSSKASLIATWQRCFASRVANYPCQVHAGRCNFSSGIGCAGASACSERAMPLDTRCLNNRRWMRCRSLKKWRKLLPVSSRVCRASFWW